MIVIQYQIGKIGEQFYILYVEVGSVYPTFAEFRYYDDDLYQHFEQTLQPFLRASTTHWRCLRYDPKQLKCAFFYSGGSFDIKTFDIEEYGISSVHRTMEVPLYKGIVPRSSSFQLNGLLIIYFSKRLSSNKDRQDDHRGFYVYKIDSEKPSFKCLGGIGDRVLQYNTFHKGNGNIEEFSDGVVFKMKNDKLGFMRFGRTYLRCPALNIDNFKKFTLQVNGLYGSTKIRLEDLIVPPRADGQNNTDAINTDL